ncbi:MAG TPA: dihydroorotate dehydrogenase [Phycisphaerae bacterium]|nr:dihydroorotate dehydrogenase [Phycisphaerae bacterium]HNU44616.1 dihydroorotate dehydrogenase [Phycisphaerae bacterium]
MPATAVDLSVDLAGLTLRNPILTASGTSGYGSELAAFLDLGTLGAFVTKSVTVEPRRGNPPPRAVETCSGMLNAIGLANVGLERFLKEKVPYLRTARTVVIVNVAGHRVEDYVAACERLDACDCVRGIELNVSCPNVVDGLDFGTDPQRLHALVTAVRPHVRNAKLIVKLSPNVTDITATATAAVAAGADALSLINTLQGMAINIEAQAPILANRCGGLSGPAIKPVALAMVHRVYTRVARDASVPVIGMGGVTTWQDVVEFLLAGATAVAVGTALFVNPAVPKTLCAGLREYVDRKGLRSVRELIGRLH